MKALRLTCLGLATAALLPSAPRLSAAEQQPAKPAERPEARRPFRDMSPEEREARFNEMQQRFGPAPFTLDELRRMPPEERQAALRKWRDRGFTSEERQKRRLQIRERLTKQIAELKARKNLSEEERSRLERLELIASRFDRVSKAPANNPEPEPKPQK